MRGGKRRVTKHIIILHHSNDSYIINFLALENTTRLGPLCSLFLTKHHSGDKILKSEMERTCGMCGKEETCIQGSWGNLMGKKPLGRPSRRWEDNNGS